MKTKRLYLLLFDILAINLSYIASLYIRFWDEKSLLPQYFDIYLSIFVGITFIKIVVFKLSRLYSSLWQFASIDELIQIVFATLIGGIMSVGYVIMLGKEIPRSIFVMVSMFDMAFIGGSRFSIRIYRRLKFRSLRKDDTPRMLIIGAGSAGVMVLNEIRGHSGWVYNPIGFIDDSPLKKGSIINRIPVLGNRDDIISVCEKYAIDDIVIAIPSASIKEKKDIVRICSNTKCKTKILPSVHDLIDGKATVSQIRDVEIGDLLGRDEVKLDMIGLNSFINGKRILVTGGGGSIGSELCRQIARFKPSQLVILEIYENTAYDIQNELLNKFKDINLVTLIGSVRDKQRIEEIMSTYKPQIVFHAAAHKHVPLMEDSPKDAIKNNIYGTLNMVQASHKHNVKKFVQISTDKAVNPTNVMGATKRVCEMIVQAYNDISNTDFVAVRFGNVLGSNGSVIPLFKKQIAAGGPVTVTHPDIIRYFMTIPEACQLVLQAGSMANDGEIFILDMGEPVKIVDLAKHLISLSGLELNSDIAIEFTGLRPGEKLFEELLLNKEVAIVTDHEKIFIEPAEAIDFHSLMGKLQRLEEVVNNRSNRKVKELLSEIVVTYKPYTPISLVKIENSIK